MAIGRRATGNYGVVLTGIDQLTKQLARDGEVWKRVQQAAIKGMTENTEDLLGRAMRDAPVDEGTLRASGTAAVYANGKRVCSAGSVVMLTMGSPEDQTNLVVGQRRVFEGGLGDAVVGEVGFNTPYALVQHERLDYHHPKGGKAKYLEENLQNQAGRYQGNLADHLRGALA